MNKKLLITAVVVSLLVTCLTVIIPCGAEKTEDLSHLAYGLPFSFIIQESTISPPDGRYPTYVPVSGPWETPTHFRLLYFIIDFLLIAQIVIAVINMLQYQRTEKHS
jgi:hypothetical protein